MNSDLYRQYCEAIEAEAIKKMNRPLSEMERLSLRNAGSLLMLEQYAMQIDFAETDTQLAEALSDIAPVSAERLQITLDSLVDFVGTSLRRELSSEEVARLRELTTVEEAMQLSEQLAETSPSKREQLLRGTLRL